MNTPIAIVGMACRFPGGVCNPDDYWNLLVAEKDAVTEVPPERFGTEFYQHPAKREPGKSYTFSAGVLDDVMGFDAEFFGISPREAAQMDPQQRLLLELAWETFEDAGRLPGKMAGSNCAVFVGVSSQDYGDRNVDDLSVIDAYSATGNTSSIVSNRISYLFDLRGPSMSIDTACSSSLVAVHQACRSIWSGEADAALAGGVNLLLHPFAFIGFSKASMLSPTGRCRAFDAAGDGYVRAEGGALILLKSLEKAIADGDLVHAVIVSSGVNSDGHSQGGINVPATATQACLLEDVYARAGIDPAYVSYVEAHGTGTAVGDPVEARALSEVIGRRRAPGSPLLIGSAKSNLGHLEPASGMAGLLKAILCLKHRAVPASIHFRNPNPNIDFAGGGLQVVDRYTPLEAHAHPLTIGINSFGFGGTNAHVLIREADPASRAGHPGLVPQEGAQPLPLMLSARSPKALHALAAAYKTRLERGDPWSALALGAARKREWLSHRAIVSPAALEDGMAALDQLSQGETTSSIVTGEALDPNGKVALVFSGNGSQWAGMGQRLLEEDDNFRAALTELDILWRADGSPSLVDELRAGVTAERLADTDCAQPLLFALQFGVVRVMQSRGLQYDACYGHSVGEVAAAWASGALTIEQAVHVIKIRSGAQAKTRGTGRMAAAGLSEAAARQLIDTLGLAGELEIAGINSPQAVTLVGALQALEAVQQVLLTGGQFFQILDLDYAFHSDRMDAIQGLVLDGLDDLRPHDTQRVFASSVTGGLLSGHALDASYWWRNIREPVRFDEATRSLIDAGVRLFVEVGPHPILRTYMTHTIEQSKVKGRPLPTLMRNQDSAADLHLAIHAAFANGASIDLDKGFPVSAGSMNCSLPTYPWQREHYMSPPTPEGYNLVNRRREHPLLGYPLKDHAAAWENQIDPVRMPVLADHEVDGAATFPGAGYAEMALAAARIHFGTVKCAVENLEIRTPVVFQPQHAKLFRFTLDTHTAGFTIETRTRMSDEPWALNVTGRLLAGGPDSAGAPNVAADELAQFDAYPRIDAASLYEGAASIGLHYGDAFRWVQSLRLAGDAALGELAAPPALQGALQDYVFHPAAMDSGFHPLFALVANQDSTDEGHPAYVPVHMGRIDFFGGNAPARVLVRIERRSPHSLVASFTYLDQDAGVIARISACRFRRVDFTGRHRPEPGRFVFVAEARPYNGDVIAAGLPAPAVLFESASGAVAAKEDAQHRNTHLTQVLPLLDVLAAAYALRAIEALNIIGSTSLPATRNQPLLERLVAMLVEDGVLEIVDGHVERGQEALPSIEDLWRGLLALSPGHAAELALMARCGAALPAVLSSEAQADTVLPPVRSDLVDHLYESSPSWSHANAFVRASLEAAVDAWREPRRLRVLEIATPGIGAFHPVAAHLQTRCDYAIAAGVEQLGTIDASSHPYIRTVSLELGEEPTLATEPGRPAQYDVVMIKNMLRASAQPARLIQAARSWMTPDAILLVSESQPSRVSDLVFGLDASAWTHERAGLLSANQITTLLHGQGLEDLVRHMEGDLEIEGAPVVIAARLPANDALVTPEATVEPQSAHWLVVFAGAAQQPLADTLVNALQAASQVAASCTLEALADEPARLARPMGNGTPRIVFMAATADAVPHDADGAALMEAQESTSIALARLVRTIIGSAPDAHASLWIVTSGGAPILGETGDAMATRPEQATLWGLGRVLMNEHAELGCHLVDVEPGCDAPEALLVRELLSQESEEEVLLTSRGRFVSRMVPAATEDLRKTRAQADAHERPAVLGFEAPGSLRNLQWFALQERELASNEVEIEPVAAGLNFRDVMYAMGLLSDEAVENGFAGPTIGMEVSGRIVRAGSQVDGFKVGDAVLGFAPACFASRVRTRATAIVIKPEKLTFAEAATIPTTFLTVYYSLRELARLRAGERVLVHGAAGGVGIAAVQIAKHLGAEVYATASKEKREFVRLLGADHVFDSRSLAFADEILHRTAGAGVDVVLNSLAGEAMVRSIDVLRPFGRFIELGKRDFYENTLIGLRPFRNNISYFGVDADQLMSALPQLAARLFDEIMDLVAQGALHPLPYRTFAAEHAGDAFRYMQQAKQVGKILLTFDAGVPPPQTAPATPLRLDPHAAYLVVGGTSGLGFATARWFVEKGARHLVLASRTAKLAPELTTEVQYWTDELGVAVTLASCDVTDAAAVAQLIERTDKAVAPLKGVVHSALSISDGLVANLDDARMRTVMAPKVAGAWNLHQATRGLSLDFFVVYSSATTFLGNPGQSNYVAANAFLESLVLLRRAAGQPACFMAWGPIDDVGFLSRNRETRDALEARIGGRSITSGEAMAALERVLVAQRAGEAVVWLEWEAITRVIPSARSERYIEMRKRESNDAQRAEGPGLREDVLALTVTEAQQLVAEALRAEIGRILNLSTAKIELDRSILDMGMDSLMGMELRMAIEECFQVKLSVMMLTEGVTVNSLAQRIVELIRGDGQDSSQKSELEQQVSALAATHAVEVSADDVREMADRAMQPSRKQASGR
ncbi:SDR family NAD(P)-dependent oxidoreductase [Paraburkholderia sp. GAS348]|uniref:SDR family NAD(P)-dependent oxidoreductase n=1 Tax=Paraburkholderia sp. GAS348 TaxID=3035132 RepID=UPI003D2122B7